jgi:hypothetical protein
MFTTFAEAFPDMLSVIDIFVAQLAQSVAYGLVGQHLAESLALQIVDNGTQG